MQTELDLLRAENAALRRALVESDLARAKLRRLVDLLMGRRTAVQACRREDQEPMDARWMLPLAGVCLSAGWPEKRRRRRDDDCQGR